MWHDLLTPSVNVPAERAKLRRLRDEIAAQVKAREEAMRRLGFREYRRSAKPVEAQR